MIDEATALADALSGVIRVHLTQQEYARRPDIWMDMGKMAAGHGHATSEGVRSMRYVADGYFELKWIPQAVYLKAPGEA